MNSRSDPYCPLLSENDDNTRIPGRNSVNSIRSTFMSTHPAKARYSVDPEAPFDVDFSKATALSQGLSLFLYIRLLEVSLLQFFNHSFFVVVIYSYFSFFPNND